MNQSQREFLVQKVQETCDTKVTALEHEIPERPSLNNYLIAACHNNSLKLLNEKELKQRLREYLLDSGKDNKFVHEDEDYEYSGEYRRGHNRHRRRITKGWTQTVTMNVSDIFVMPQAYLDAMKEYEDKKAEIEKKVEALQAQANTIIMKIKIGSSNKLETLVLQIDNVMGDLDLINTQLLLGVSEDVKQLTAGKKDAKDK